MAHECTTAVQKEEREEEGGREEKKKSYQIDQEEYTGRLVW